MSARDGDARLRMSARELAPFVQALRGRGGAAIVARIKAHPLAPPVDGVHYLQLATILATAHASQWRPAAEAVAREMGLVHRYREGLEGEA